jgi:hypothetical protein
MQDDFSGIGYDARREQVCAQGNLSGVVASDVYLGKRPNDNA